MLFDVRTAKPLGGGVLAPPGSATPLGERLGWLQVEVGQLFLTTGLGAQDVLVCEGPAPLVLNPQSALKVEHVRGIFEVLARERGVLVPGRINPRTVQAELLGMRGKQLPREQVKEWAREVAQRLFGEDIPVGESGRGRGGKLSQDVVDALLIGALAVSRLGLAIQVGIPLEDAFGSANKRSAKRLPRAGRGVRWSSKELQKLLGNE